MSAHVYAFFFQKLPAYRACKYQRRSQSARRMSAASVIVVSAALVVISEVAVPRTNDLFELVVIRRMSIGISDDSAERSTRSAVVKITADDLNLVTLNSRRREVSAVGRAPCHLPFYLRHIQLDARRQIVNDDAYRVTVRFSKDCYLYFTAPYCTHCFLRSALSAVSSILLRFICFKSILIYCTFCKYTSLISKIS